MSSPRGQTPVTVTEQQLLGGFVCIVSTDSIVQPNILLRNLWLLQSTLNEFMSLGKPAWQEARQTLTRLLSSAEGVLRDNTALRQSAIIPQVSMGCGLNGVLLDQGRLVPVLQ